MFAERNSILSQVSEYAVRLADQKNLFIENRIKKEYRNDKIVRIKRSEIRPSGDGRRNQRSFLKLRVTNTTVLPKGRT
jgi:hypothetical protein